MIKSPSNHHLEGFYFEISFFLTLEDWRRLFLGDNEFWGLGLFSFFLERGNVCCIEVKRDQIDVE